MTAKGLHAMAHDVDPADVVRKAVGDLKNISVPPEKILLGLYVRPEKTLGNIIIPDKTRMEDHYQGKAALVLKLGSAAFKDDGAVKFYGFSVKEGDWVVCRVAYGLMLNINSHPCKIVDDRQLELVIPSPDVVY